MKTLFTFALTILTLFTCTVNAQSIPSNTGITKVYGAVKSPDQKPAEFVTIALLRAKDSVSVKGLTTDETGTFEFVKVKEGKYLLSISSFDYQPYYSSVFEIKTDATEKHIEDITLAKAVKSLKEVTVIGSRPLIEQKLDKTVLNVESSITSNGSTAIEVLQKAPGITVDNEGNISLKGKSGVVVLIDGKQTYLSNSEVADMLKNMSSSSISQVEIMTNPPAKYDAAGNAGVINIKLKKGTNTGFNGSVNGSFGQGNYGKGNAGINMNYRQTYYNLFGNYNFSKRTNMQDLNLARGFYDEGSLSHIMLQNAQMEMPSQNNRFKTGIDIFLTPKQILGFLVNGSIGVWESQNPTYSKKVNPGMETEGSSFSKNHINEDWNNFTYNTNYKYSIDSNGRELSADIDFAHNKYGSNQLYNTTFYNQQGVEDPGTPQLIQKGLIPSSANIIAAKVDYTHPISKSAKFDAGLKSSFVSTKNAIDYYDQLSNGDWQLNAQTSNHFDYDENINAAYLNFSKEIKKFSFQLGLRGEQTRTKGNQRTTNDITERNYFQLFPTAYIKYEVNKNNALQVSYSRRVNRPDYESLNPFRNELDPYTYQQGNPDLKPQISNGVEFSHILKGKYTTTINYSKTTDVMTDLTAPGAKPNSVYITKANLSTLDNYGISFSAPINFTKWWSANAYANVYHSGYKGHYLNDIVDRQQTTFSFNAQNTFTFAEGFTGEVSGFYNSKMIEGIIDIYPMWQISAGVQKSILDKKGSIKLNVNDIFNVQQFKGKIKYSTMDIDVKNRWDSRVATLSFTYRFGNSNLKTSQHNSTSSNEEANRAKQGKD
ncbi:TonB-dependent receptor [Solitalea sp. MAHUQ-68]|uniref:TonB-dependent receptor n=1 Tax=Solitalea agri TaxID=2953739 RepID=A0A9X2JCE6_9SPHI|nr:TonB-dependent receptor [Solitalea agri]MCO4292449.1 TonB-dependent receptor [Solitalea agri]